MKGKLVHQFQETGYTCACAVAKMVLDCLKGIDMSEIDIEFAMGAKEGVGSGTKDLISFLEKQDIKCTLFEDSTIEELIKTEGLKIALYSVDGLIPHAAVIKDIGSGNIHLFDPSEGKCFKSLKEFEKIWFTDENKKSFILLSYESR